MKLGTKSDIYYMMSVPGPDGASTGAAIVYEERLGLR